MPPHPHPDKGPPNCDFTFNGKSLRGYAGEPIAASLIANQVEVLHRSLIRRNPRGVRCAIGRCGQCLLRVNGRPNVRSCTELLLPGMEVETQTGYPNAANDILRPFGAVASAMPAGFQYRLFIYPKFLQPLYHRFLRSISGYGRVNRAGRQPLKLPDARLVWEKDVVIVGAGVSGMSASLAAADAGASVQLLDDQRVLGGNRSFYPEAAGMIADLAQRCLEHQNIEIRLERTVLALENGVINASTPSGIEKFRAKILIIATGGYDDIGPFPNNDRVRIFGERGALRVVRGWSVRPATSVVVYGPHSEEVGRALQHAGLVVEYDVPRAPGPDEMMVYTGSIPTYELQFHAEVAMTLDERGAPIARTATGGVTSRRDVFVTGEAAGNCGHEEAARRGALSGTFAAAALKGEFPPWNPGDDVTPAKPMAPVPDAMCCACEDVSENELVEAMDGDYADIESAKRFTSLSMGICQGKYCLYRARCIAASVEDKTLEGVPMTTQRPPIVPTTLAVLAAKSERHDP